MKKSTPLLSPFSLNSMLLSLFVFFLMSCAGTQLSTDMPLTEEPVSLDDNSTQALTESGWEELEEVSSFLPRARQFVKEDLNALWVRIRYPYGVEPSLDSILGPVNRHFRSQFQKVDFQNRQNTSLLNREGIELEFKGLRNDSSFQQVAFIYKGTQEYEIFSLSSFSESANLKDELLSLLAKVQPNAPQPNSQKPLLSDNLNDLGIQVTLPKEWSALALNEIPYAGQRIAYANSQNQCFVAFTGAKHENREIQANALVDAYLLSLGLTLADDNINFKRKNIDGVNQYLLTAPSVLLDDYTVQIDFRLKQVDGVNQVQMSSLHCPAGQSEQISWQSNTVQSTEANQRQEAFVLNQIGLQQLVQKQSLLALSYFEQAQQLDPSNPDYLANCGFVYQEKDLYGPGIQQFASRMELVQRSGTLLKILGEMFEHQKEFAKAFAANKAAFEYLPFDEELAINMSDVLWGMGRKTESYRAVNDLYRFQKSQRLGLYLAKTLLGLEHYQDGATLLAELREKYPLNVETAKYSMIAYLFLQKYDDALAMAQQIEKTEKLNLEMLILKGKSEFYLKRFKDALATFNRAKKIQDNNEEVQSFLAATKSFLGIAQSKILQRPISPVFKASSPFALVDLEKAHKLFPEKYSAIMHYRNEELEFTKVKPWTITEELVIQILDEKGVSSFQEFNFSFIPGYDRIFINKLDVYDSTQALSFKGNPGTYYVSSDYGANANSDVQLAHIPLRDLKVGDFIHLQWSRQSIDKSSFAPFMHHMFNRTIPTGLDRLVLKGDLSQIQSESYGDIESDSTAQGLVFEVKNPEIIRKELYSPHYRDIGAGVMVSHLRDWASVGKEYENMIRHQMKTSIPVQEKAYEIRGNLFKTNEVIEAMIEWIRKNVVYENVLFGDRTIIPVTAETTMKSRKGDCKDQSLLLKQMLATFNIPAHLTLIHISTPVSPALPSLQQFDHMILHIPAGKDYEERFVDLTEQGGSNRIIPYHLEDKYALIINGDDSELITTPKVNNSKEHYAKFFHTVGMGKEGSLSLKDSLVLSGKFGVAFRDKLYKLNQNEQRELLKDWLIQDLPEVFVQKVETENLEIHDQALIIKVWYNVPHLMYREENTWIGDFPNVWERSFMNLPRMRKRHHPIRLPDQMEFESTLTWVTNGDQELEIATDPINPDRFFTKLNQEMKNDSRKTILKTQWTTFATYAEAEEYERLRQEWQEVIDRTLFKVKIRE